MMALAEGYFAIAIALNAKITGSWPSAHGRPGPPRRTGENSALSSPSDSDASPTQDRGQSSFLSPILPTSHNANSSNTVLYNCISLDDDRHM